MYLPIVTKDPFPVLSMNGAIESVNFILTRIRIVFVVHGVCPGAADPTFGGVRWRRPLQSKENER